MCKKQTTAVELVVATLRRLRQEDHGASLGYKQLKTTTAKNSSRETPYIYLSQNLETLTGLETFPFPLSQFLPPLTSLFS